MMQFLSMSVTLSPHRKYLEQTVARTPSGQFDWSLLVRISFTFILLLLSHCMFDSKCPPWKNIGNIGYTLASFYWQQFFLPPSLSAMEEVKRELENVQLQLAAQRQEWPGAA
jgi:hypothetical protein